MSQKPASRCVDCDEEGVDDVDAVRCPACWRVLRVIRRR